jgi:hypothetical protein
MRTAAADAEDWIMSGGRLQKAGEAVSHYEPKLIAGRLVQLYCLALEPESHNKHEAILDSARQESLVQMLASEPFAFSGSFEILEIGPALAIRQGGWTYEIRPNSKDEMDQSSKRTYTVRLAKVHFKRFRGVVEA